MERNVIRRTILMQLALRIFLCLSGSVLLSLGLFIYEDEERKIQSKLQDWWIWLDDRKQRTLSSERNLLARVTDDANRIIDTIFGPSLLSYRSLRASMVLSGIVGFTIIPASFRDWLPTLLLAALGTLCTYLFFLASAHDLRFRRWRLSAERGSEYLLRFSMSLFLLVGCFYQVVPPASRALPSYAVRAQPEVWAVVIAMGGSFLSDFLLIALFRRLLRRASQLPHTIASVGLLAGIAILTFADCYVPYLMSTRTDYALLREILRVLMYLNSTDGILFLLLLSALVVLAVHHVLWPALLRPLYAVQRTGVLDNRKLTRSLGVALISGGLAVGTRYSSALWDAARKLLSGQ